MSPGKFLKISHFLEIPSKATLRQSENITKNRRDSVTLFVVFTVMLLK
jgi:hypothetical protein